MKRVLLLATGGTIASRKSPNGLTPQAGAAELLAAFPALKERFLMEARDLLSLDSSNIQAEEWQTIARAVWTGLDRCDGVVITHGTDTMAYTASVLSFMLPDLHKPVVLTGSQLPMDHLLTDARSNLATAFAAVELGLPGVTVAFDHKLIRGCRAAKVRTMAFDAFESVNAPYVARVYANGLRPDPAALRPDRPERPTRLADRLCTRVFLLKLIPGTDPAIFDKLSELQIRGVVLETFGVGGLHYVRRDLLPSLTRLIQRGVSVVACSQCLYETSDLSLYEVGRRLLDCGVIPARDMTTEAVVTKLMWALGQTDDPDRVRAIFDTDLAGEVTL